MAIPPTGSAHSASNPVSSARVKTDESAPLTSQTDSPTVATTSALQQTSAASNPGAAANLTQTQAETARVILKGTPHPGPQ